MQRAVFSFQVVLSKTTRVDNTLGKSINLLKCVCHAPGRFAPKPVPPGTIPPGHFAQNFERDCSLQSSGTFRSKTKFTGRFTHFHNTHVYSLKIKFGDTVSFLEQYPILQIYKLQCIWSKRKTVSQTQGNRHNKRT